MFRARDISALATSPRRTPRFAAATSLFVCLGIVTAGCRTPYYQCRQDASAGPPILSVRLDDQRPKWERKFYLGGAYEDITFIPVERIGPTPLTQFHERLAARFEAYGVQPTDALLRVISCRVVVNSNHGHTDHLQLAKLDYFGDRHRRVPSAKDDWTQHVHYTAYRSTDSFGRPCDDDDDDDSGSALLGLGFVASAIAAYAATLAGAFVAYEGTRNVAHWLHLRPGYPGPPKKLDTGAYAAGTTFELYGELTVTLPTGENRVVYVRQKNVVPAPHNPGTESVKTAVAIGVDHAAEKAVREVLGLPEPTPPEPPSPVPTSSSDPNGPPSGFAPLPPRTDASSSQSAGSTNSSVEEETRRIQEANRRRYEEEFGPKLMMPIGR
jgi:hypothetical protein